MKKLNDNRVLTVEEIAEMLNCNTWRITKSVRRGALKGYRQFGVYIIFENDLEEFIKSSRVAPS